MREITEEYEKGYKVKFETFWGTEVNVWTTQKVMQLHKYFFFQTKFLGRKGGFNSNKVNLPILKFGIQFIKHWTLTKIETNLK